MHKRCASGQVTTVNKVAQWCGHSACIRTGRTQWSHYKGRVLHGCTQDAFPTFFPFRFPRQDGLRWVTKRANYQGLVIQDGSQRAMIWSHYISLVSRGCAQDAFPTFFPFRLPFQDGSYCATKG